MKTVERSKLLRRSHGVEKRGFDYGGRDRIDADLVSGKFDGELARQRMNAAFCHRGYAGRRGADALKRPNRSNANDRTSASFFHFGDCALSDHEIAAHEVEIFAQVIPGYLRERLYRKHARIIEKHVHPAELVGRRFYETHADFGITDVACDISDIFAGRIDARCDLGQLVLAPSVKNDTGARRARRLCCVGTHSCAATGDDDNFTLETHFALQLADESYPPW